MDAQQQNRSAHIQNKRTPSPRHQLVLCNVWWMRKGSEKIATIKSEQANEATR